MSATTKDRLEDLSRQKRAVGSWLCLAVASLLLAGTFAVVLVVGRLPGLSGLFTDSDLFRRGLVVHVVLSLVIWFYAFTTALHLLVPDGAGRGARLGPGLATAGVVSIVVAGGATGGPPILANYVPVIDHPLFLVGLLLFAVGVGVAIIRPGLWPSPEARRGFFAIPAAAHPGLRAAAVAMLLAIVTFHASFTVTPTNLPADLYYERVMWGGGHVLQFASVAAMISVWLMLLTSLTGEDVISRRASALWFGALITPLLAAPLLPLWGTDSEVYRTGFTRLMELGIFPVVMVMTGLCLRALRRARRRGVELSLRDPRLSGFWASVALTLVGFCLGAMISGSNTLVPAHYHASIGAVTAAFMAMTYGLLEPLGARVTNSRLRQRAGLQPLAFGVGQLVFTLGFAMAGAYGTARKTYAADQALHHLGQKVGLAVMGIGGLLAVVGGIAYLALVVAPLWHARARGFEIALKEKDHEQRGIGAALAAEDRG